MDGFEMGNLVRDGSHFIDGILEPFWRQQLIEKNQNIESDKENSYIRKTPGGVVIFEGNKHSLFKISGSKDRLRNS